MEWYTVKQHLKGEYIRLLVQRNECHEVEGWCQPSESSPSPSSNISIEFKRFLYLGSSCVENPAEPAALGEVVGVGAVPRFSKSNATPWHLGFWSWELLKRVLTGMCQSTEGSRLVRERWRRNWGWGAYVVVLVSKVEDLRKEAWA
jgi:hypothetical protein